MSAYQAHEGNGLIEKLRRGELVTAMMIRSARNTDAVRVAGSAGYDSIIIDLEHSSMPLQIVSDMASAAHDLGMTPFVRVPERDYGSVGRVLDGGATGVIAARIETPEQAEELARACRFAPRGQRSQIAMVPQLGFKPTPARELNPLLDRETIVKTLIETPLGAANADAIAQVDGVDMLAIGANDLSAELGAAGDYTSSAFYDAVATIAAACAKHGKLCVIGGIADFDILAGFMRIGVAPMIISGSDIEMLYAAARQRNEALKHWHAGLKDSVATTANR
ncbi:aldolase/citrate lyase family protein [Paraburkholderia acidicola]|uniref:Aldolase/citrate lyase family protein n=1 Tax=Paraburkholderia acidicola TaxID=1912599 RepID=A0ABV1LPZ0_9BURK